MWPTSRSLSSPIADNLSSFAMNQSPLNLKTMLARPLKELKPFVTGWEKVRENGTLPIIVNHFNQSRSFLKKGGQLNQPIAKPIFSLRQQNN